MSDTVDVERLKREREEALRLLKEIVEDWQWDPPASVDEGTAKFLGWKARVADLLRRIREAEGA